MYICLRAYLTGGDVAATGQLRQLGRLGIPKNGLRSHQGDIAATAEIDWSVAATRETKTWLALSRRGDVSETCSWRLKKSPKNRTCLNFPRLPGDPASLRNQRKLESPPIVSRPVRDRALIRSDVLLLIYKWAKMINFDVVDFIECSSLDVKGTYNETPKTYMYIRIIAHLMSYALFSQWINTTGADSLKGLLVKIHYDCFHHAHAPSCLAFKIAGSRNCKL